ncbi:MarR family winged helix-turn-helix transcriptional regulator [Microbacterium sediminis]|uniref:MarR family winged helix-turn-helix transcriptional regulator n=1 Tax=Microbacterium sediminis TaxID=904291 RepID=UPI001072C816|nr:hypothetical protein [Microbacterium sediminis]QBR73188.1 hypothetical protein E3O41_01205 [Microbacterium sediminis]
MNTTDDTPDSRPIGFWLTAVDRLLSHAFDAAFEGEPVDRRDWMALNQIDGTVAVPLPAHPRRSKRLARLARLGWIERVGGDWALTDAGRAAKERLGEKVAAIRSRVADAVPADDLATTLRTLETLARAFGWSDGDGMPPRPRRHGDRRPFPERAFPERPFAEHAGFDGPRPFDERLPHPRRPFGAGHHGFGPHHHAERAFERGFRAGFERGRA